MAEGERRGRGAHPPLMRKVADALAPLLQGERYASQLTDVSVSTLARLKREGHIVGRIGKEPISLTETGQEIVRQSLTPPLTLPPRLSIWAHRDRGTTIDAAEDLAETARRGFRRGKGGVRRPR